MPLLLTHQPTRAAADSLIGALVAAHMPRCAVSRSVISLSSFGAAYVVDWPLVLCLFGRCCRCLIRALVSTTMADDARRPGDRVSAARRRRRSSARCVIASAAEGHMSGKRGRAWRQDEQCRWVFRHKAEQAGAFRAGIDIRDISSSYMPVPAIIIGLLDFFFYSAQRCNTADILARPGHARWRHAAIEPGHDFGTYMLRL